MDPILTEDDQHQTSTWDPAAGDREQLSRSGKLQMVPLTKALPAAIVVLVENRSLNNKNCVVPRSPSSASSSSSIGGGDELVENAEENEVQSPLAAPAAGPLDRMEALESSLPLKKGLSRFFGGKSRSFTSLKEVSSAQELSKPESPFQYAKRRKLLLHSSSNKRGLVRDGSSSWSTCTVGVVGMGLSSSSRSSIKKRDWATKGISPASLVSMSSMSFSLTQRSHQCQHRVSSIQNF